jgi:hypothetical protein
MGTLFTDKHSLFRHGIDTALYFYCLAVNYRVSNLPMSASYDIAEGLP